MTHRAPLACAVAGLGRIGSLLEEDRLREKPATHAAAIVKNPDCVLVAGCDPDEDRRKLFEKEWGVGTTYGKTGAMLDAHRIDILHVATPPHTHLEIVREAVCRGVGVVVCEKPLAPTASEAKKIALLHEKGGVKILVNHERRYSKDYVAAKRHIETRSFGALRSIHAALFMGERSPAACILLDDGTHLVDIIRFLTGSEIEILAARRYRDESQDSILVTGEAGGVPLFLEVASGRNYVTFELDLFFQGGRIRIGNGLYEEYQSAQSPYYEGMRSLSRTRARRPYPTGYFSGMMADAVSCARDRRHMPVSSATDGLRAMELIDRVKGLIFSP
ncbi:MAG: Gfo/Idh/MocA family oxidoreductase [Spirochaetes bacterium]|nr:Gfo/Idh/MocA family oxidoreductase [Spirochaetota bacterium]